MMRSLESLGRVRLQALIILVAVFVIGGLTGAAIDRARHPRPPARPPGQGLPPHLREKLALSTEQDRRIEEILASYRPRTDALFDRIMPSVHALTDSMRTEIRAVLTAAQQAIFDTQEPPPGNRPPLRPGRPPFPRGGPPPGAPDSAGGRDCR
jgi:uncharacterized membrane protein